VSYDSAVVKAMTLPSAGRRLGVGARSPTGKRDASELRLSECALLVGDGCLWWPFAFFALCFCGLWSAGGGVRSVNWCCWLCAGERVELGRTAAGTRQGARKRGGSTLGGLAQVSQRAHCLAGAARSMFACS
jgi:hypothetical protein